MPERPTLETVAAHAGVSRATVSRVVNGAPTVDPDLRRRVEASLRELGYVPHGPARALAARRSRTVAIVIGEPEHRVFGDPFIGAVVRGARAQLAHADLDAVLVLVPEPADQARCAEYLTGGHLAGAVLLSLHGEHPLPGLLRRAGVPTVVSGRPADPGLGLPYVDIANDASAEAATRWLRRRGRRRIGVVAGPQDMPSATDRLAGYRSGLDTEYRPLVEVGDYTRRGGRRAAAALLAREPDLDAVFATSDQMALGVLRALRDAGRSVPDDVAVVGFDDVALDDIAHADSDAEPPLTTVHQPAAEMGRGLVRLLLAGGAEPPVIFPTRLVVRRSA